MDNELIKYPRTYHLPFSLSKSNDDKDFKHLDSLIGKQVIATLKLDGQNCTMTRNYIFQRSINSRNENAKLTGTFVKQKYNILKYDIPEDWRICGEDMTYVHSIRYSNLDSPYYVFSIWDAANNCLSYKDTLDWCELLNLNFVTVVYEGIFDLEILKEIFNNLDFNTMEGLVIRPIDSFHYSDFSKNVCKAVRANHVQTDSFWATHLKFNNFKK